MLVEWDTVLGGTLYCGGQAGGDTVLEEGTLSWGDTELVEETLSWGGTVGSEWREEEGAWQ